MVTNVVEARHETPHLYRQTVQSLLRSIAAMVVANDGEVRYFRGENLEVPFQGECLSCLSRARLLLSMSATLSFALRKCA
jgi:uncharacterized protein (UPF0216 family)